MKLKNIIILFIILIFGCTKKKTTSSSEITILENGLYYFNLSKQEKYSDLQRINFLNRAFSLTSNLQNSKESRNLLSDIVFQYYAFELNDGFNNSSKVL